MAHFNKKDPEFKISLNVKIAYVWTGPRGLYCSLSCQREQFVTVFVVVFQVVVVFKSFGNQKKCSAVFRGTKKFDDIGPNLWEVKQVYFWGNFRFKSGIV